MLNYYEKNIGGPFYNIIRDIYRRNCSSLKVNGHISESFEVHSGVRQGDVMSPLLFNIFINDIIDEFQSQECDPPVLDEEIVGCLLYADDLVILSTSPQGLQKSLDKLMNYCNKWRLQVNLKKSKTMCMQKCGRQPMLRIKYNSLQLEQVKTYSYLGIDISSNGSYKQAEITLSEKARKAMFKLKSLLYGTNIKPNTCLQLFDQLIKPICLYGSEIWGIDRLKTQDTSTFNESLEKYTSEKLNLSFAKFSLGVHKKAQSSAVRGELGRYPLGLDITSNIISFYSHIYSKKANPLLTYVAKSSKYSKSWIYKCEQLLDSLQITNTPETIKRKTTMQLLKNSYKHFWCSKINTESKMRTFNTFKTTFSYEEYLNIGNVEHRKSMTRFRISAHNLAIERGRYTKPHPTPVHERVCPHCPLNIEDEIHFLTQCQKLNQQRQNMYAEIKKLCINFDLLSDEEKFLFLMISEGEISEIVARFLSKYLP